MSEPKQVDSKVPRGKAAFHTLLPALAFLIQGTPGLVIVGLTGAAMAVSVLGGPKVSLIGRAFKLIRRAFNLKPGQPEAAAPHIFAEAVGAIFLLGSAAALLWWKPTVGWGLALIVVALAALNWLAGICVGCQMYLLISRLRGRVRLAAQ
jgi:hypothetical protein